MNLLSQLFNQPSINQLDPSQVHEMWSKSPKPFLLDVRSSQEYKLGHINGSILIPLDELSSKIDRIPKGREVICICESGSRSSVAARHLNAKGYKVSNLRGGMSTWIRTGLPVKTELSK